MALQVGQKFTRKQIVAIGTKQAGIVFDCLKDGGYWPWPNARAVFQRRGRRLIVVATI